jgi:hypothetical protein
MKILSIGVAIAAALTLGACSVDPVTGEKRTAVELINAAKDAVNAGIGAARDIRCGTVPGADIEELWKCEEAGE